MISYRRHVISSLVQISSFSPCRDVGGGPEVGLDFRNNSSIEEDDDFDPRGPKRGVTFRSTDDIRPISLISRNRRLLSFDSSSPPDSPLSISSIDSDISFCSEERKVSLPFKPALSWLTNSLRRKKKPSKASSDVCPEETQKTDSGQDVIEEVKKAKEDENHNKEEEESGLLLKLEDNEACVVLRPPSSADSLSRRAVGSVRRAASLRTSKDSLSEASQDLKDRLLSWRRSSTGPDLQPQLESLAPSLAHSLAPSSPCEASFCEGSSSLPWAALGEEDSGDMIEDRKAQQRLQEVYLAKSLTAQDFALLPPQLPPKPTQFHILQLERLQEGRIRPREFQDTQQIALLLDSLRVVSSMESQLSPQPEPEYSSPRPLEVARLEV